MGLADFNHYGKDVRYLIIAGIIFLFVIIFFVIVHFFFTEEPVDKTYTFSSNSTLQINVNESNASMHSKEHLFTTMVCELSQGYDKCADLVKFQLSGADCCPLGFCCNG